MNGARTWLAAAVLSALACSSGSGSGSTYPYYTGSAGSGPATAGTGGGGASGTVTITINQPMGQSILSANSVASVSAMIDVQGGSDFIDSSSVKVTISQTGNTGTAAQGQLVSAGTDVYAGSVSLSSLPSGSYTLTVTASSSGGATGSASVDVQVDDGPTLTINSPVAGRHYKGSVVVEVVATAGAYGPLDGPHALVAGLPLTLSPAGPDNTFRATVDFSQYTPPLDGEQLLDVWAANANGVRVELLTTFVVDNEGPTIALTTPAAGAVVGGIITVSAVVTDDAGVLDSSVIAVIGDDTTAAFTLPLTFQGAGVYSTLFDTAKLTVCPQPPAPGPCIVYPTISFRASDALGNQTAIGYVFSIDNVPPVADLDPPELRIIHDDGTCSWLLDPLSPEEFLGDMPHDGDVVPQVFDLRARIEDDGNTPPGIKDVPISGIDPDNTSVYVLDDTTQPIVVDSDGDGVCDHINPTLIPTTAPPVQNNQLLKIRLAGVTPAGDGNFTPDPTLPNAICQPGTATTLPKPLCDFQLPVAIGYAHGEPAIWAIEDINPGWCFGRQLDTLANNIGTGWACIAVGTADLNGNVSVSRPLRVYVTADGTMPVGGIGTPPACTGVYDQTTGTVSAGACTARHYTAPEYCLDGDCPAPPP